MAGSNSISRGDPIYQLPCPVDVGGLEGITSPDYAPGGVNYTPNARAQKQTTPHRDLLRPTSATPRPLRHNAFCSNLFGQNNGTKRICRDHRLSSLQPEPIK
jgi:hypothetical protein